MTIVDPGLAQAQVQPAPASQYGGAVKTAAEHAAFVVDVRLQRHLYTQLMVFPMLDAQAHRPGQWDVVVQNGFQVAAIAAHAGWIPNVCGYRQTSSMTAESRYCQFPQRFLATSSRRSG